MSTDTDNRITRQPDFVFTDEQALAEGSVIDMSCWGVATFRGRPIPTISRTLHALLKAKFTSAIEVGALPPWAVLGDLLERLTQPITGIRDTDWEGEASDVLYTTDELEFLDGKRIWLHWHGDGWIAMLPEDY